MSITSSHIDSFIPTISIATLQVLFMIFWFCKKYFEAGEL